MVRLTLAFLLTFKTRSPRVEDMRMAYFKVLKRRDYLSEETCMRRLKKHTISVISRVVRINNSFSYNAFRLT